MRPLCEFACVLAGVFLIAVCIAGIAPGRVIAVVDRALGL